MLYAYCFQNSRDSQSTNRIDAVDGYGEVTFLDRLNVHQFEIQYLLHMIRQIVLMRHMAQRIHFSEGKVLLLRNRKHALSFGIVEELAMLIEQFERIPLFRIMTGGEDDTSCRFFSGDRQFRCRCCCQTDIHHVIAHAHQRTANDLLHHMAAQTGIMTHYDHLIIRQRRTTLRSVCCRETNDIDRTESFSYPTADRSADTGNTLY